MQYILTEAEYKNLVPKDLYKREQEKVQLLNDKVVKLSQYCCHKRTSHTNFRFYCDGCPIGALGTKTCTEKQQYLY